MVSEWLVYYEIGALCGHSDPCSFADFMIGSAEGDGLTESTESDNDNAQE